MNRWRIPPALEAEVRARDTVCVYCGVAFSPAGSSNHGTRPSWEHIVNDINIVTRANIVLCCCACNASKGQKALSSWLQSAYCQRHGITEATVAPVVRDALKDLPRLHVAEA